MPRLSTRLRRAREHRTLPRPYQTLHDPTHTRLVARGNPSPNRASICPTWQVSTLEELQLVLDSFGGGAARIRLHADSSRTRLYVTVPCDAKAADKAARAAGPQRAAAAAAGATRARDGTEAARVVVEFVLSVDLNHAFAIHHPATSAWRTAAAKIALDEWREEWWEAQPRDSPTLCATLLPALMQPLLASKEGGGQPAIDALSKAGASQRTRLIRMGMYADSRSEASMVI